MSTYVSLFRAINVGGNAKVGMAGLKEMHEALGFKKVVTLLQTGNVVFESDEIEPAQLEKQIAQEFERKFGFATEVMVRTATELKELVKHNPFVNQPEKETKWVLVLFLSASPDQAAQQALFSSYTGPEEMFITGKEMFIYYPDGMGRSKLTNILIERKLKVTGTGRNWNTVTKLLNMTQS
jgi:uncharacterized protein (DUF1697 family)